MNQNNPLDKNNLIERLDRNLDWIKSCDTKASIVIAVLGVFLTIFTSENSIDMLKTILSQPIKHISFSNFLYLISFISSLAIFIFGLYCLIRVLIPRLSKETQVYERTYNDSLYFFETIAKNSFQEFKNKVEQTSEDDEIKDILFQIYINAKICTIKYNYYSKGIKYSSLGVTGILILYIVGIILVMVGGFK
ncbi:hypothetical protein CN518_27620 [Bacillus anthracis]|nr:hypothetical protein CN518_27620 [Bacillus anthracis]PFA95194.1 hypothetical protein CN385_27120 [Bacillus anthracis]